MQNYGNYVLTAAFTAEMLMKLFALGVFEYISDAFNVFDAAVVLLSLLELLLSVSPVAPASHPEKKAGTASHGQCKQEPACITWF